MSECSRDKLKRKSASHKSTDSVDSGAQSVDAVSTVVTPSPSELQDSVKTEDTCGASTVAEVSSQLYLYCIT